MFVLSKTIWDTENAKKKKKQAIQMLVSYNVSYKKI